MRGILRYVQVVVAGLVMSYFHLTLASSPDSNASDASMIQSAVVPGGHYRVRRNTRTERTFVVNKNLPVGSHLFSVASIPPDDGESFAFLYPRSDGLELDTQTGMVSRGISHQWNDSVSVETFYIVSAKKSEPSFLPVRMVLISRDYFDPILTNEPVPLFETISTTIQPGTVIFTASAIDKEVYGADVIYKLESGGDLFKIDSKTGNVMVSAKQEWPENKIYKLAISAQCVGAAFQGETPAQVLRVQVGVRDPQFYIEPIYIMELSENSGVGSSVASVQVKSFQELPMTYQIIPENDVSQGVFTIDSDTGALSLLKQLRHVRDSHQYRYSLTVSEITPSPHKASTTLIINLKPENRNAPFFGTDVFITRNFREDSPIGTTVMTVSGTDLDQGVTGELTFSVNNENFGTRPFGTDGKEVAIVVEKNLDYDYQPDNMYEFQLTAIDGGTPPQSGSATVQVFMENVNDQDPVFLPEVQSIRIKEGASGSLGPIHVVQGYDPDLDGLTFQFNVMDNERTGACKGLNIQDRCGIFTLDRNTGHIHLNTVVGKGLSDLVLSVNAIDDGSCCISGGSGRTSNGKVEVAFMGVNRPPRFPNCGNIHASVSEGLESDAFVLEIEAEDSDSGVNGDITYSVVYKNLEDKLFGIRPIAYTKRYQLYTLVKFDRERPKTDGIVINGEVKYRVTVKAEDNGTPKLSTNCFFFVTINDQNDNAPQYDDNPYKFYMLRTTNSGDRVGRVFAIDDDEGPNAAVTYRLENDPVCPNCFYIDPSSGWILRGTGGISSNVEKLTLNSTATDNGQVQQANWATVEIYIVDNIANLPPQWQRTGGNNIDDTIISLDETASQNTEVGTGFQAIHSGGTGSIFYFIGRGRTPQENKELTFRGSTDDGANMFKLFTNSTLDYGVVPSYTLKLRASTGAETPYSEVRLQINLIMRDLNNMIPEFVGVDTNGIYPAAVSSETQRGDDVIRIAAIDLDGTSPNNLVTYGWDVDCDDCNAFFIDRDSGRITAAQTYDRNTKASYQLKVVARDGTDSAVPGITGPNVVKGSVNVLVIGASMQPPYFPMQDRRYRVNEGSPFDTEVVTLTATDPDPTFNYPQYTFISGKQRRNFAVEITTGRIYVTGGLRSINSPYTFEYRVFDGYNINSTTITVEITKQNLFDPVFNPLSYENTNIVELDNSITPSNPRMMATVQATDPDNTAGSLTYYLEGKLVKDNQEKFSIDRTTGEVSLLGPLSRDYPDGYENWQLTVRAVDEAEGGLSPRSGYGIINLRLIDINNNAPVFDTNHLVGYVDEESYAGVTVLQLVATDVDAGPNGRVTYKLPENPDIPQIGGQDLFSLSLDGRITTTNAAYQIKRLTQDRYYFTVVAQDNAGTGRRETSQMIEIVVNDINNHNPWFATSQYALTMPEMIPVGGSVGALAAMDEDLLENARRIFTVSGSSADSRYFEMDSIYSAGVGVIRIRELVDFDSMTNPVLSFNVRVENPNGGTPDSAVVDITVTDINDNVPIISPGNAEFNITQLADDIDFIQQFTATDRDSGDNALFEFAVDYQNSDPGKKFIVDPASGEVKLRNNMERDIYGIYEVYVLAIDKGEPPLTGTATLTVLGTGSPEGSRTSAQPTCTRDFTTMDASQIIYQSSTAKKDVIPLPKISVEMMLNLC